MAREERIVHGLTADGGEIARYETAGKWYVEYGDGRPRRNVTIKQAAALACAPGAAAMTGQPGGRVFDAKVRKLS